MKRSLKHSFHSARIFALTYILGCCLFVSCGKGGDNPDIPSAPETRIQKDSLVLIKINTGNISWNHNSKLDTWQGVAVRQVNGERRVVYLDLHNSQLSGKISSTLNELTALEYLDLSENKLSDNIPYLGGLSSLQILDLHSNNLSGKIADNVADLRNLTYLSLGKNSFYSELPTKMSQLTKLIVLDVSEQRQSISSPGISGGIPSSWSVFGNIQYLYLHKNALTGTIPQYLTSYKKLKRLTLDENNFVGEIPAGFGNIASLENISMSKNNLTGNVPVDLVLNPNWDQWKDQIIKQETTDLSISGSNKSAEVLKSAMGIDYELPDKGLFYEKIK